MGAMGLIAHPIMPVAAVAAQVRLVQREQAPLEVTAAQEPLTTFLVHRFFMLEVVEALLLLLVELLALVGQVSGVRVERVVLTLLVLLELLIEVVAEAVLVG